MPPKTILNISPKVFVGLACGLGLAALTAVAGALTPELFASLGAWQAPALIATSAVISSGAAWLKREEDKIDAETGAPSVAEVVSEEAAVAAPAPTAPAV